jgi:hypothetical protein
LISKEKNFDNLLHTTIHSNIAAFANSGSNLNTISDENIIGHSAVIDTYQNYIMTGNNYFTPKSYEIYDTTVRTLDFWFKDYEGHSLPIFQLKKNFNNPYDNDNPDTIEINQLVFKIEGEILII